MASEEFLTRFPATEQLSIIEPVMWTSLLGVVIFSLLLFFGTREVDTRVYNARLAWIRAFLYFSVCWFLSSVTGVLNNLLNSPLVNFENVSTLSWQMYVGLTWCVVLFGYLYIWPTGTVTYQRKLYPLPTLLIGVIWGLSEAQLFLVFWWTAESLLSNVWLIALMTYVMAAIFNPLLHVFWWDRYVSPDHNIYEWNLKKVSMSHNPTLVLSIIYLALWEDLWVFLFWPAFGLLACAFAQKFPAPWDSLAHGELEAQQGLCDVQTLSVPKSQRSA